MLVFFLHHLDRSADGHNPFLWRSCLFGSIRRKVDVLACTYLCLCRRIFLRFLTIACKLFSFHFPTNYLTVKSFEISMLSILVRIPSNCLIVMNSSKMNVCPWYSKICCWRIFVAIVVYLVMHLCLFLCLVPLVHFLRVLLRMHSLVASMIVHVLWIVGSARVGFDLVDFVLVGFALCLRIVPIARWMSWSILSCLPLTWIWKCFLDNLYL